MTDRTGDGLQNPRILTSELDRSWDDGAGPDEHVRTLVCRTIATGRFGQRHHIRDLPPIMAGSPAADAPTLLSEDIEPHPSEMLLAALNACLTVSVQANALARSIPVRSLEVHSRGDVDPSALWGTGERRVRPIGFQSISVEVRIGADVPREVLQSLVDYAVLWSPLANTMHDPVDLDVALVVV